MLFAQNGQGVDILSPIGIFILSFEKRVGLSKHFPPFTIPQKDNCDLCRFKTNKRREAENPFLDQLFKTLYRDRFDFIFD